MFKKLFYAATLGCLYSANASSKFTNIDLKTYDLSAKKRGFEIAGANKFYDWGDNLGWRMRSLGDINGDGIDDFIVGAPFATPSADRELAGIAYVIFGKSTKKDGKFYDIDLKKTDLAATGQGFRILGVTGAIPEELENGDYLGYSVSNAGDFNGDGINDIIIGANQYDRGDSEADRGVGAAYIIFGQCKSSNKFYDIDLRDINLAATQRGFRVLGADPGDFENGNYADQTGTEVSYAGDINGDKCSDVIIGVPGRDLPGRVDNGAAHVLFGNCKKGAKFYDIDLRTTDLAKTKQGFSIFGEKAYHYLGFSVSNAGDFNNDGCDDVVIGSLNDSKEEPGLAYVVFGNCKKDAKFSNIDLKTTNLAKTKQGFKIIGESAFDQFGSVVSNLGDFNGDGYDDIVISAVNGEPTPERERAGVVYVFFGKCKSKKFPDIDLRKTNLASTKQGFRIWGVQGPTNWGEGGPYDPTPAPGGDRQDALGYYLSGAGDFNNDGCSDMIMGAPGVDPSADRIDAGAVYVMFGKCKKGEKFVDIDLKKTDLADTKQGFKIIGAAAGDNIGTSVTFAGDLNNDGKDDIAFGAPYASPSGRFQAGITYVLFSS